jgi:hypothetical protein
MAATTTGRQQRPVVHLRPALLDRHVQTELLVGAVGHGLIEAAVRGLCFPVGGEGDLVLRMSAGRGQREQEKVK